MIVDTSAVVAILRDEAEAEQFTDLLLAQDDARISAGTLLEVQMVALSYRASRELEEMLDLFDIEVVAFDEEHAVLARAGFEKYVGDCFAYALAKAYDEPLLFKGGDFSKTDVRPAVT
jgi:ribonuclease VapC